MAAGETSPALEDTGLDDATPAVANHTSDLARDGHTDEPAAQVGSEAAR